MGSQRTAELKGIGDEAFSPLFQLDWCEKGRMLVEVRSGPGPDWTVTMRYGLEEIGTTMVQYL